MRQSLAAIYSDIQVRFASIGPDARPWPRCRYVYFIRCESTCAVKIGVAARPRDRLTHLQSGNSLELDIVALIESPANLADDLEQRLHQALARWHIRGEWFSLVGEVAELIEHLDDVAYNDVWRREILLRHGVAA